MTCLGCEKSGGLRPCLGCRMLDDFNKPSYWEKFMKDEIIEVEGKKYKRLKEWSLIRSGEVAIQSGDIVLRPLKEKPMPEILPGDLIEYIEEHGGWVDKGVQTAYALSDGEYIINGTSLGGGTLTPRLRHFRNGNLIWSKGDE